MTSATNRLSFCGFSHRIASYIDAVCFVDQPIKDAIGRVGSPICSCHFEIGRCEVRIVERT